MIISFHDRYYCMCRLQTRWAPRLYPSLTRCSWALAVGGESLIGAVEEELGGGFSLSHQFETDLFFHSEGHQLLTSPHPIIPPHFLLTPLLPSFFLSVPFLLLLLTVATVCCSGPCVRLLFVLCICACVLILNHFCHCLFRWATVVWTLLHPIHQ